MTDRPSPWPRRRFLAAAGAGIAAAVLPAAWTSPAAAGALLRDAFADPQAAARIGRAYLADRPADEALGGFLDRLARRVRDAAPLDPPAVRAWLGAEVRADFAAGRLVLVDGWLLAPSEAAAMALVALS